MDNARRFNKYGASWLVKWICRYRDETNYRVWRNGINCGRVIVRDDYNTDPSVSTSGLCDYDYLRAEMIGIVIDYRKDAHIDSMRDIADMVRRGLVSLDSIDSEMDRVHVIGLLRA